MTDSFLSELEVTTLALAVPCPECRAVVGRRCVNEITGEPCELAHYVREEAGLMAEVVRLREIAEAARFYVAFPDRPEVTDPNEAHDWDLEAEGRYLALRDAVLKGEVSQ